MSDPKTTARRGLMLILSSPSGAGKTTLSRMLLDNDADISLSVSCTTRPARPGEVDGVDYRFLSDTEFDQMVADDAFLEHATVFEHRYGTPRQAVEDALASGKDVLFDIDWQGTQQIVQRAEKDVVRIFILPPDMDELERRLKTRAQDSDEVVAKRMSKAEGEISHWAEYDYVIINDELGVAFQQLQQILAVERRKLRRQAGVLEFVKTLKK